MLSTKSFILGCVLVLTGGFGSVAGATSGDIINSTPQGNAQQQIEKSVTPNICVYVPVYRCG